MLLLEIKAGEIIWFIILDVEFNWVFGGGIVFGFFVFIGG